MRKSVHRGLAVAAFAAAVLGFGGVAFAGTPVGDSPGTDVSATMVAPTAQTVSADATVVVDGVMSLALDANDKSFTLQGSPDDTATSPDDTVSYIVTTNNLDGYAVSVASDTADLTPADATANSDVVPFADITATGTASAVTVPNSGTSTGSSTALSTTGGTIYNQTARSDANGDEHLTTFSADIPFVAADTYTGTVTFTASPNS